MPEAGSPAPSPYLRKAPDRPPAIVPRNSGVRPACRARARAGEWRSDGAAQNAHQIEVQFALGRHGEWQ